MDENQQCSAQAPNNVNCNGESGFNSMECSGMSDQSDVDVEYGSGSDSEVLKLPPVDSQAQGAAAPQPQPSRSRQLRDCTLGVDESPILVSIGRNHLAVAFQRPRQMQFSYAQPVQPLMEVFYDFTSPFPSTSSSSQGNQPRQRRKDARQEFLVHVTEASSRDETVKFLSRAWDANPIDAMKLICHLRDFHGGKGLRTQYQECLLWLYKNHPRTLYGNLEEMSRFGYWKDALEFLMVIAFDGYVHPHLAMDDLPRVDYSRLTGRESREARQGADERNRIYNKKIIEYFDNCNANDDNEDETSFVMRGKGFDVKTISAADMTKLRFAFARKKFESDVKYRVFHVKIAQIFAEQLIRDMETVKDTTRRPKSVSMAGKWAPSLDAHFDRYTLIASTIATHLAYLTGTLQDYKIPVIAVYLARKMYHKEFCVPLRQFQEVPEVRMSAREWGSVNYNRVPTRSMQKNKEQFMHHDAPRFENFLMNPIPTAKDARASLRPLELIGKISQIEMLSEMEQAELEYQWACFVQDTREKDYNALTKAVVVCDVSDSMGGTHGRLKVALGLTLLTMVITEIEPWNSSCITFHETPSIQRFFECPTIGEKVRQLLRMEWGSNTNLNKVFKLIIEAGKMNRYSSHQIPNLLIVLTDMKFELACRGTTERNFEEAKAMFASAGYKMPKILFWNLSTEGKAFQAVEENQFGVILFSGWSGQLLAQVLNQTDADEVGPDSFLTSILQKTKYKNLMVYD